MRTLSVINDPVFTPQEYDSMDKALLGLIRDERDLPFLYLILKITSIMMTLGVALYFVEGWLFWVLSLAYFVVNNFVFKGPFGLMLHCTSHRKFFVKKYEFMNKFLPWVMGPFFGQTPETYYSHHIHMHHAKNNLPDDLSTTMTYQRDSLKEWLRYWGNFMTRGLVDLAVLFHHENRPKLVRKILVGEGAFIAMCIVLSLINFKATLMVFMVPFLISRIIMMLGNWTQHAFIDASDPGNPYKNSITCINVKYNHKCWNDGYHISHHQKPAMHWTKHPEFFQKTLHEYAENKAVVFDGIDFLQVFVKLMRRDYDSLAENMLNIDNTFSSKEEAIALLKERTQKIEVPTGNLAFA